MASVREFHCEVCSHHFTAAVGFAMFCVLYECRDCGHQGMRRREEGYTCHACGAPFLTVAPPEPRPAGARYWYAAEKIVAGMETLEQRACPKCGYFPAQRGEELRILD